MATNAQINANRSNSQHSTGPSTPEGKHASSQNATTHGAYSAKSLIPGEDAAQHEKLFAEYMNSCKPVGPLETHAAETMADCKWKLRRLSRIEDATYRLYALVLTEELATLPDDPGIHLAFILAHDAENNKMLKRLPQQQAHMHRLYAQSMKELRALQTARKAEAEEIAKQTQICFEAASLLPASSPSAPVSEPTETVAPAPLEQSPPAL